MSHASRDSVGLCGPCARESHRFRCRSIQVSRIHCVCSHSTLRCPGIQSGIRVWQCIFCDGINCPPVMLLCGHVVRHVRLPFCHVALRLFCIHVVLLSHCSVVMFVALLSCCSVVMLSCGHMFLQSYRFFGFSISVGFAAVFLIVPMVACVMCACQCDCDFDPCIYLCGFPRWL